MNAKSETQNSNQTQQHLGLGSPRYDNAATWLELLLDAIVYTVTTCTTFVLRLLFRASPAIEPLGFRGDWDFDGARVVGTGQHEIEERVFQFAKRVRHFVMRLPPTICNVEDVKHLVQDSGSLGASYIEGKDARNKRDYRLRMKTARKEAKESIYWLRLVDTGTDAAVDQERIALMSEGTELVKIFGTILRKSE